jgi:hypothetical protein
VVQEDVAKREEAAQHSGVRVWCWFDLWVRLFRLRGDAARPRCEERVRRLLKGSAAWRARAGIAIFRKGQASTARARVETGCSSAHAHDRPGVQDETDHSFARAAESPDANYSCP